ncbi:MAG: host attachment protein [Alphaproteobacteria bacterium]
MKHQKTWYVIADGGRARFVVRHEEKNAFDTIKEIVSPDLHSPSHELGSERPGRTHESANAARHAIQPRTDPHTKEKHAFAAYIGSEVNQACGRKEFQRLVLIAPGHVLHDIKEALDETARRKVVGQLQKDLTRVPNADLPEHLSDRWAYTPDNDHG